MKNIYYDNYINLIYQWNSNIILQANLKSLITLVQNKFLKGKNYQQLNDIQKSQLQNNINLQLNRIQQKVQSITDNLQYQSWLYQILKQEDKDIDQDYQVITDIISKFTRICKRPDLNSQQRNINNYKTFQDLTKFILSFENNHRLNKNIYQQENLQFKYRNSKYTIYFINEDQYNICHKLFGGVDLLHYFNTGWCVAKNQQYFNNYINYKKDQYNGYFVMIQNNSNKPLALIHFGSGQIKDTSDKALQIKDNLINDCLQHININWKYYKEDLLFYASTQILQKLTNNSTYSTKLYIANNKNTPAYILQKLLLNYPYEDMKSFIAKNPNTPSYILQKLSNDQNYYVIGYIAKNPNTPSHILQKLSNNQDLNIIKAIANNPNTLNTTLQKLANIQNLDIRCNIASNSNASNQLLQKLSNDQNSYVRKYVANNHNTPIYILQKLSNDQIYLVRIQVALNPNTPQQILQKLSNDQDQHVRRCVGENPNTPINILKKLITYQDFIKKGVLKNPNTPVQILQKFANNQNEDIRAYVAENPNTPINILKKLAIDLKYVVRNNAIKNLNNRK